MKTKSPHFLATSTVAIILAASSASFPAFTQAAGGNDFRLENDVVPAPDGFETVATKYVAARPTDIYISPFIWGGKVKNVHFAAGQPIEILAKPKGYDWLLVGKDGAGIGYVPLSVLAPAKQ
jgi:hypothetical protein